MTDLPTEGLEPIDPHDLTPWHVGRTAMILVGGPGVWHAGTIVAITRRRVQITVTFHSNISLDVVNASGSDAQVYLVPAA